MYGLGIFQTCIKYVTDHRFILFAFCYEHCFHLVMTCSFLILCLSGQISLRLQFLGKMIRFVLLTMAAKYTLN